MKLTKKYYIEGVLYDEGTEFVIASDGETQTVNATADEPENEIEIINENEVAEESEKTDEVNEEEEKTTEEDE